MNWPNSSTNKLSCSSSLSRIHCSLLFSLSAHPLLFYCIATNMKRSLAPSSLFLKRTKVSGEYTTTLSCTTINNTTDDSTSPTDDSSDADCTTTTSTTPASSPAPIRALNSSAKVNHLDRWKIVADGEKENNEDDDDEDGSSRREQAPEASLKNIAMTESSPPLYYLCYYRTRGKDDEGNGSYTVVVVAVVVIVVVVCLAWLQHYVLTGVGGLLRGGDCSIGQIDVQ
jgi:hypothetical protein